MIHRAGVRPGDEKRRIPAGWRPSRGTRRRPSRPRGGWAAPHRPAGRGDDRCRRQLPVVRRRPAGALGRSGRRAPCERRRDRADGDDRGPRDGLVDRRHGPRPPTPAAASDRRPGVAGSGGDQHRRDAGERDDAHRPARGHRGVRGRPSLDHRLDDRADGDAGALGGRVLHGPDSRSTAGGDRLGRRSRAALRRQRRVRGPGGAGGLGSRSGAALADGIRPSPRSARRRRGADRAGMGRAGRHTRLRLGGRGGGGLRPAASPSGRARQRGGANGGVGGPGGPGRGRRSRHVARRAHALFHSVHLSPRP